MAELVGPWVGRIAGFGALATLASAFVIGIWMFDKRKKMDSPVQAAAPAGWYRQLDGRERWWDGQAWSDTFRDVAVAEANQAKQFPAGWFPDYDDRTLERYWDGARWTASTRPTHTDSAEPVETKASATPRESSGINASTVQQREAAQPRQAFADARKVNGWVSAGSGIEVAGYAIDAGLIYVGRKIATQNQLEPSLIDPALKVDRRNPDRSGRWLDYWPSYARLRPDSRAAYLEWLAGGRQDPNVPIGYVFLFMYGLERRAFVDIPNQPDAEAELREIRFEMARLLDQHPDNGSFNSYARGFINVLDVMLLKQDANLPARPPELADYRWEPPIGLRVTIGNYAADRQPVPVDWALAWAWFHPQVRIRTAATRCTAEFAALFDRYYTERFDAGLIPANKGRAIKCDYWAASAAIRNVNVEMSGIKDVLEHGDNGALTEIVDQAQGALDAYSRYVGKRPDAVGTIRADALLPAELLELEETAPHFRKWLAAREGSAVDGAELLGYWDLREEGKANKADSVLMAQLAQNLGYGLEPDPRFGGPSYLTGSPVRIFGQAKTAAHIPSPEYQAATTAAHLAVSVSAADGQVSLDEVETVLRHIQTRLDLPETEIHRLANHVEWLADSPVKLTGLTRRIEALPTAQRDALGQLMIDIALADGVATPDEIKIVSKVFKLLGLDETSVSSRLHSTMTGATEPVLMRVGQPDHGVAIPERPAEAPAAGFALDAAVIERKRRDTASVSALLSDIFEEETPAPAAAPPVDERADRLGGLDASHSRLARAIEAEKEFDREWLEALCVELGLLPDGALDTLNEAALDACDEPLVDGDDPYILNDYALEELTR